MYLYFSDIFDVDPDLIEEYGAFNISLVSDLPLFIDPFLLFNSENPVYQGLHEEMIRYVRFLKEKALQGELAAPLIQAWFAFPEVRQNWFGYSATGNRGHGLGRKFATALSRNFRTVFRDFGEETISIGSHLEKLTLVRSGVGRDNISDFATNMIKGFLLEYTQEFAKTHIDRDFLEARPVRKVRFNYSTESWESASYELPIFRDDFVLLTPKDILTKDDTWISHKGLVANFSGVLDSLPNAELRVQLNNYFVKQLPPADIEPRKEDIEAAIARTIEEYPELLDYYVRSREDRGNQARSVSSEHVRKAETLFIRQLRPFISDVLQPRGFYGLDSQLEAQQRVEFLKQVIENEDGWRIFYVDGKPIESEAHLQILFRFVWYGSPMDVNPEVNKGRGPVDFKVSAGSLDKTLIEFKLAKNTQLERNLAKQVEIYEKANQHPEPAKPSLKVILYFTEQQHERVLRILKRLGLENEPNVVLIDARNDNKPSASKA